jgi:hypothetical protein
MVLQTNIIRRKKNIFYIRPIPAQIEYYGVSMDFMTCLAPQRVEDEKRSRFQSGASKRMNDDNLKVPMI